MSINDCKSINSQQNKKIKTPWDKEEVSKKRILIILLFSLKIKEK